MSRLPLKDIPVDVPVLQELVLLMETLQNSLITDKDIREWTKKDPLLSIVYHHIQFGWPCQVSSELQPFCRNQKELSSINGCILRGSRVLVPEPGQQALLKQLHEGNPGICHMKSLAWMYMWWPGMDKQIEEFVKNCEECQVNQSNPATAQPISWSWPRKPWSRLHLDYAGPIENKIFLILVDSHTKWMEIFPTKRATSTATITKLRWTFLLVIDFLKLLLQTMAHVL